MKKVITEVKNIKSQLKTGGFVVSEKQLALDLKMVNSDLWGTLSHVLMLHKQKIISNQQIKTILKALLEIQDELLAGKFHIDPGKGAQLTLEAKIVEKAGDAGYSVHTGRSRNDQVMVTELLHLREKSLEMLDVVHSVANTLLALAEEHKKTIMPGYTHMQPAKVTTFGQWALAYTNGLLRASKALINYYQTFNMNPLGACESYGTSWPLDREYTTKLLGFNAVWEIPQDAIASRGLVQLGYLTALRDIAITISKITQDLLLFTTFEYNMVSLGDDVAQRMHPITGSSVMAQKKNPDVLEIMRATAPQIIGFSSIVANLLASLPMGYNRDSREAKEYIDLGFSKTFEMLKTLQQVLSSLIVNKKRMEHLVITNYSLTTDLADYISQKSGIGYRLIYKIVGQVVDEAISQNKQLSQVSAAILTKKAATLNIDLQLTDSEIQEAINPEKVINKRNHVGGSSPTTMALAISHTQKEISSLHNWIVEQKEIIKTAKENTFSLTKKLLEEV